MCLCWNRRCEATFPYWEFARVWKNDDTHARYRGMGGEHPGERVKMILGVTEFRTGSLEHRSWNVEFGASGFEVGVWNWNLALGAWAAILVIWVTIMQRCILGKSSSCTNECALK